MKILLVGNYRHQAQRSMERFLQMLADGLASKGDEVCVACPKPVFGKLRSGSEGVGKWLGYLDRFLIFPWVLLFRKRNVDVVHICDHGNAIYVPILGKVPHLVTCHDLLSVRVARGEVQGRVTGWSGKLLVRAMIWGLSKAQLVACGSNTTRQDLKRLIPNRSMVDDPIIEYGQNYGYAPMSQEDAKNLLAKMGVNCKHFLFHVGNNNWYKNRLGLLRIYSELRRFDGFEKTVLVMAGKPFNGEMREFVDAAALNDYVIELENPSNEELRALYCGADALVWPSLAEGFGWPVIEAQACGCPVFASNRLPMPDVAGDGAVYFDPENTFEAAKVIADSWGQRETLVLHGKTNCLRFDSSTMIEKYRASYHSLMGAR